MTAEEAKKILAERWWEVLNPLLKREDYKITIGDVIRENNATENYWPDCYIISTHVVRKDGVKEEDDDEPWNFAVSKIDGKCCTAVYIA